jgi:hypothetical protein
MGGIFEGRKANNTTIPSEVNDRILETSKDFLEML